MKMTISLCLWMVMLTVSRAAVIDQRPNEQSVQMETTIDDLMNALAQVTKSKGMFRSPARSFTRLQYAAQMCAIRGRVVSSSLCNPIPTSLPCLLVSLLK